MTEHTTQMASKKQIHVTFTDDGIPRVDTRPIAERLGIQHENLMGNISNYSDKFQQFGILRFETGEIKGRGQPQKYVLLNEDQMIFAMTLSRNTPEVVQLKADLVMAFKHARAPKTPGIDDDDEKITIQISKYQQYFVTPEDETLAAYLIEAATDVINKGFIHLIDGQPYAHIDGITQDFGIAEQDLQKIVEHWMRMDHSDWLLKEKQHKYFSARGISAFRRYSEQSGSAYQIYLMGFRLIEWQHDKQRCDTLTKALMRCQPKWKQLARYWNMGLTRKETMTLTGMSNSQIQYQLEQMRTCEILPKHFI